MAQLKNSIINYDKRVIGGYNICDYFSLDFIKINEYVTSCPDEWFEFYKLQDNDKLEKIAFDIYGDSDYWDILLIINKKNPLFEMSYDYDTIKNNAEYMVSQYEKKVNRGISLPLMERENMLNSYEKKLIDNNEKCRVLKIIRPSKLHEFINVGYEMGYFN